MNNTADVEKKLTAEERPAISVIIPMYNTEKYIRLCLISVMSQKFQDYEVIVVDDCSTDNSVIEVEKLIPHFDGKLKLIKRSENSGRAGLPRNEALKISRGKYIAFLDSDDMWKPNALLELYTIAEETQAEVVHLEKFYLFNDDGTGNFDAKELKIASNEPRKYFVDDITFITEDMTKRIRQHVDKRFFWSPWGRFFRRDFLIDNRIEFPAMVYYEDLIFCFKCLCLAKKYVRVPNVVNIIRVRPNSASSQSGAPQKVLADWLNLVIEGMKALDNFMKATEFFIINSEYRYMELKFFMELCLQSVQGLLRNSRPHEIESAVTESLSAVSVENAALISLLLTEMYENSGIKKITKKSGKR